MSENTINAGVRRLGFTGNEMTAHGFLAMSSTLLNESGKWNPDPNQSDIARHLRASFIDTCDDTPENSQLCDYGRRFVTELNARKLKYVNNAE